MITRTAAGVCVSNCCPVEWTWKARWYVKIGGWWITARRGTGRSGFFAEAVRRKQAGLPVTGRLVFCEHPHVYTLGKSGKEQNMLLDALQLRAKHAEFVRTNRGGDITYHGPGQLVGYPILDLEHYGLGLKRYIYIIEETVIRLLGRYGVRAGRLDGLLGCGWMRTGRRPARYAPSGCAVPISSPCTVSPSM